MHRNGNPSYADYGRWEHNHLPGWLASDLDHWKRVLRHAPDPFLPSPVTAAEAACDEVVRHIDAETVICSTRAAASAGGPPLSALVAACGIALSRVFGQEALTLGTITNGRVEPRFDRTAGCFINPLALLLHGLRRPTVTVLKASAERVLDAFTHSRLPFDELVRALHPPRGRHPWFQALAVLQDPPTRYRLGNTITVDPVPVHQPRTRREWLLQAFPQRTGGWELVAHSRADGMGITTATTVMDELIHALAEIAALREW